MTSTIDLLLWVVIPYVTIAVFVVGMIWRYRYDKFGWTTRSSLLYEGKLMRVASPLFHIGLIFVVAGHVIGLLIPEAWTNALGLDERGYHIMAVSLGLVAGIATLVGVVLLIYRRRTVGPVFLATTKNDKLMYIFLFAAICLGITATILGSGLIPHDAYNYRLGVAEWFRSIIFFHPEPQYMVQAPLEYRLHALAGLAVFFIWPFTRLVHAFSAPVGYAFRPYIVYRDRDETAVGNRAPRRGWEKIGTEDRSRS